MSKQEQHRIPKVYWRQFGYVDEHKREKVSVIKIGEKFFRNTNIESFTTEINIFDLPFSDLESKRLFEKVNSNIDNAYPKIIKDLKEKSALSEESESTLIQLIPNLLCRTVPFRELINHFLTSEKQRENFLKSMCAFLEDKGEIFLKRLESYNSDDSLNLVCAVVMHHLITLLSIFNYVVLKCQEGREWWTSDDPIILERNFSLGILGLETEIYFPISRNFCIYYYHSNSKLKDNILQQSKNKSMIIVPEDIQRKIQKKIIDNAYKYIVCPVKLTMQDLVA